MRMDPIEIKVHLNPGYKSSEIMNYFLQQGFDGRFIPLFTQHTNEFAAYEYTDESVKGVTIKDREKIPYNVQGDTIFGAFLLDHNQEEMIISRFNLPIIIQKSKDLLSLSWSQIEPVLKIDINSQSFPGERIFYVDVTISHGLWGSRHKWLEAMLRILEKQKSANKGKSDWVNGEVLLNNIRTDFKEMKKLEKETLNLSEIRDCIWKTMTVLCNKYSREGQTIHVTPRYKSGYEKIPMDLSSFKPRCIPEKPIKIPGSAWTDSVMLECLAYSSPEALKERIKRYWIDIDNEKEFMKLVEKSVAGPKDTWESIVEIMTKRRETPDIINKLLSWMADPNWPGYGTAREHLVNFIGSRGIPYIKNSISLARTVYDEWWAENLEFLLKEITFTK